VGRGVLALPGRPFAIGRGTLVLPKFPFAIGRVATKATVCDWEGIADLPIGLPDTESESALGSGVYFFEFGFFHFKKQTTKV
jgi:hypothetical protein